MPNANSDCRYVVVGSKPWSRLVFGEVICKYSGCWHFIGNREDLNVERLRDLNPRFVFFLHWSWKVPQEIFENYECIVFHMTDVPYGRGGSPLQNLIVRGQRSTKLTALRMTSAFDAGPVYLKEDLGLEGSAEEIYLRMSYLAARMIAQILRDLPVPAPQTGTVTEFHRRKPEESEIPQLDSLKALHDFIRMLDAEGYPRAFLVYKGYRYQLSRAIAYTGRIVADVEITLVDDKSS